MEFGVKMRDGKKEEREKHGEWIILLCWLEDIVLF